MGSEAKEKKRVKAEKREQKATRKEDICSQEGERGGNGKEEDKVARSTKKDDFYLLSVAQL